MTKLIPIEFKNERIITTKLLAEKYETDENNIKNNFNNHKERFEESKHYYLLQGEKLKEFKNRVNDNDLVGKNANQLYLWTERGILRHAKILDTEKAWDMYEELEETYFKVKENNQLNLANKEIEKLEATVNRFEKLTEDAKLQYKPSHKRKLDYNKMIKSLVNSKEEEEVVKDWIFATLNISKWEDSCVNDTNRIIEIINAVSRLLTIKKFEQLRLL